MRLLTIASAVLFAFPAFAQQQPNCGPRPAVIAVLKDRFGESVQSMGINNGVVFEMWANVETGTWTILVTRPDGVSCIPVDGNGFERVDSDVSPTGARL